MANETSDLFNIEAYGVSVGRASSATPQNPLFESYMPTIFNESITMLNVDMSDGWKPLTLAAGVIDSTEPCGRTGMGAMYKVEGNHHIYISMNVSFTAAQDKILATIPVEYAPSVSVASMGSADVTTGTTLLIVANSDGTIVCERAHNGSGTQLTSTITSTDIYFDYFI